jgi:hypothetical protein
METPEIEVVADSKTVAAQYGPSPHMAAATALLMDVGGLSSALIRTILIAIVFVRLY